VEYFGDELVNLTLLSTDQRQPFNRSMVLPNVPDTIEEAGGAQPDSDDTVIGYRKGPIAIYNQTSTSQDDFHFRLMNIGEYNS
jgi:hypothetical protein